MLSRNTQAFAYTVVDISILTDMSNFIWNRRLVIKNAKLLRLHENKPIANILELTLNAKNNLFEYCEYRMITNKDL